MSRTRQKNPSATFEALKERIARGRPAPAPAPSELNLSSVKLRPEVFQHRSVRSHASEAHSRQMADALKVGRSLPPITVWWDGRDWTCLDGHHRAKAYVLAGQWDALVPVEVFEGSPEEALARAADANTKEKLQMSPSEKLNSGWRLVVLAGEMPKAKQAEASDVSPRQIAYMRKAKGQLLAAGTSPEQLAEMSWAEARAKVTGQELPQWDEGKDERRAEELALKLRKALGSTVERQPRLFMMAVEKYSAMLAKGLQEEYLAAHTGGEEDELEEGYE